MLRFSIKALIVGTTLAASYLGFALSMFSDDPLWAKFVAYATLAGLVIGCCVYQELYGDERP
jgi:hypothetical protein